VSKDQNRIQRSIERLVENHMAEHGVTAAYQMPPFPEPLCTFVNPLCPEDLCYLPYDHVGSKKFPSLMPAGTERKKLISVGWKIQREWFPGQVH
jgi:hypothetical protein